MSNTSSVIKQHNCKVLSTKDVDGLYNCRKKDSCPLDGKGLQTCIVYKVHVITDKLSHIYYGCNNQPNSFRHRHHKQDTERSNHIWSLQHNLSNTMLVCK